MGWSRAGGKTMTRDRLVEAIRLQEEGRAK